MSAPTMGEHKGDGIRYEMHLSAPKGGLAQMLRDPEGQWVAYRDYADLQAEKEAETRATFDAIRLITQLRDENERLRKAGDAMALAYCNLDVDGYEEESAEMLMQTLPTLKAWLAAKEGRDAK